MCGKSQPTDKEVKQINDTTVKKTIKESTQLIGRMETWIGEYSDLKGRFDMIQLNSFYQQVSFSKYFLNGILCFKDIKLLFTINTRIYHFFKFN